MSCNCTLCFEYIEIATSCTVNQLRRLLKELRSLQNLAVFTEIVVTRLEQEIASLELALAYDQERECF